MGLSFVSSFGSSFDSSWDSYPARPPGSVVCRASPPLARCLLSRRVLLRRRWLPPPLCRLFFGFGLPVSCRRAAGLAAPAASRCLPPRRLGLLWCPVPLARRRVGLLCFLVLVAVAVADDRFGESGRTRSGTLDLFTLAFLLLPCTTCGTFAAARPPRLAATLVLALPGAASELGLVGSCGGVRSWFLTSWTWPTPWWLLRATCFFGGLSLLRRQGFGCAPWGILPPSVFSPSWLVSLCLGGVWWRS